MRIQSISTKIIAALFLMCALCTGAAASNNISVYVEGEKVVFDTDPYITDGHTMVPMRGVMEALGATVSWEENNKTATAIKNSVITKFAIGSHDYYKNGAIEYMDAPAVQLNSRTYVPLRAISESFGFKVEWDEASNSVYITSGALSYPEENIYYIKSANGRYLTYEDGSFGTALLPSACAMWAFECADSEKGIYRIYSMSDLESPIGLCMHSGSDQADTNKKKDKIDQDKTEQDKIELSMCTEEDLCWTIECIYGGGYILRPHENESLSLDVTTASLKEILSEVTLIPCV